MSTGKSEYSRGKSRESVKSGSPRGKSREAKRDPNQVPTEKELQSMSDRLSNAKRSERRLRDNLAKDKSSLRKLRDDEKRETDGQHTIRTDITRRKEHCKHKNPVFKNGTSTVNALS